MTKRPLDRLREIGFELAGEWALLEGAPHVELRRYADASNVLYAFVSGAELLYVGRSGQTLRRRMEAYEQGGPPHTMRQCNHERIAAMLTADQPIDLYAMPNPGNLFYGSFRVNLAAGLQHSVIEALDPSWNGPSSATTGRRPAPTPRAAAPRHRRHRPYAPDDSECSTPITTDRPRYRFLVGYRYMDDGFFNVPLRYASLFGKDRERIKILCGNERAAIHGHIDRSSNTNAAPRIIGGGALRAWFADNAGVNNAVDIDILAPNAVWLRVPGTHFD